MRKLYFLLPGTTGKFGGGGLWAELKTVKLAKKLCDAEIVTYRQRETDNLFLEDVLKQNNLDEIIFIVSWGFDVPKLVKKLKDYNIVYHAHSAEYNFNLPSNIPIITVSRNTMGYWGKTSPNSLIYYLPNQIGTEFYNQNKTRNIDILVQTRKTSDYVLKQLIPTLETHFNVRVLDGYVQDLAELFNCSKIYIYDSAEYWNISGCTEGFGLPPLEALACGCWVFTSVNSALSDYLDPGFNCDKIAGYSLEYDLNRISKRLTNYSTITHSETFFSQYQESSLLPKFKKILQEINQFFDFKQEHQILIPSLNNIRFYQLLLQKYLGKIRKKVKE